LKWTQAPHRLDGVTKPLAKEGDEVVGVDTHIVLIPSPGGPVPTPLPSPFRGPLSAKLSSTVFSDEKAAATVTSQAQNTPPHVPAGGPFQTPPSNEATVEMGSNTVFIDEKSAARLGDPATTCNDPTDLMVGRVVASGTVFAGD
jgi:uncharacterized Zn-binding protein involved in type VI secretion